MIAISMIFQNDVPPHIMNDLGNLLVFFRHSALCFISMAPNKSSSIVTLANINSLCSEIFPFQMQYQSQPVFFLTQKSKQIDFNKKVKSFVIFSYTLVYDAYM